MQKLINDLDQLLELEQKVLLAGDLERIEEILFKKTELTTKLSQCAPHPDPRHLQNLREKADRNNTLYLAATKGLEKIRQRLDAISAAKDGFKTYGANGQMRNPAGQVSGRRV